MANDLDPTGLEATSLARLGVLHRLAMGAAHTLNNAFTTVIAEASFLHGDRKHDAEVVEACESILREMDRCTAITHALLTRRSPSQVGSAAVDLARLVRELGHFLAEALGRHHTLDVRFPDDLVLVAGEAVALEQLVLSLVVYAADQAAGGATLTLGVEAPASHDEDQSGARAGSLLWLDAEARDLPVEIVDLLCDPSRAEDPLLRIQLGAIQSLVDAHGAAFEATREGPERWRARIRFPALP